MISNAPAFALLPDKNGFYGKYGGRFVPEILYPNLVELEAAFKAALKNPDFWQSYMQELSDFSGRPTPLTFAKNLTKRLGGAKIFIKREDLSQTGAHKINNVIGQGILAKSLGKKRMIAETGAGQHGIAVATMAARFGFEACIYMGAQDVARQRSNVFWMERLGAKVISVTAGAQTLKDAINDALRDWSGSPTDTHYVLGTACGPHPFPALVAYFQSIIGLEARAQIMSVQGELPSKVFACVGGGSNAVGIFQGFLRDSTGVELVGVEAGGKGTNPGEHACRIASSQGSLGIAHGYKSLFVQSEDGQMLDTHSVSAGLDYVGVSPILVHLHDEGKVRFERASDLETIAAFEMLMKEEGIIAALESSHAFSAMIREVPKMKTSESVVVCLSGRGDKDIFTIAEALEDASWNEFLASKVRQVET